jgi:indolepyruvate ferredoxin oxidoreductase, beta subunit
MSGCSRRFKLVVVGVGGQGVLTVAIMVGDAALANKQNVVVGQLHGMSQRGGSVETTVLIGPGGSSFVDAGDADVVLAFEPLEALRALPYMSAKTRVVVNLGRVVPFPLSMQGLPYPDTDAVLDQIREVAPDLITVPGTEMLEEELGELRCLNLLMFGALAGLDLLPLDAGTLRDAAAAKINPRFRELNLKAFDMGLAAMS